MADSFTLPGGDDVSLRCEVMLVVAARKNDVSRADDGDVDLERGEKSLL
jgi:hypothetical protein